MCVCTAIYTAVLLSQLSGMHNLSCESIFACVIIIHVAKCFSSGPSLSLQLNLQENWINSYLIIKT